MFLSMLRAFSSIKLFVSFLCVMAFTAPVNAEIDLLSLPEDQQEAFKNLSPSQQQALMKKYAPSSTMNSINNEVKQEVIAGPLNIRLDRSNAALGEKAKGKIGDEELTDEEILELSEEEEKLRADFLKDLNLHKSLDVADLNEKQVDTSVSSQIQPFGYDLFLGLPSMFAPLSNAPMPSDYVVGPGDVLNVHIYGVENEAFELQIDRDGNIQIPKVGPLQVSGLSFIRSIQTG
ncbi:exported hypothetical protein [uncultured Thiomicrorhabdus sp.]